MKDKKTKEVAEYEIIKAPHPVTGEMLDVRIEKNKEMTPEERDKKIRDEISKYGLVPSETVETTDPISGQKYLVPVDRTGHNERKLIMALADPNLTRDRKDFELSMYMFERGKENVSMLLDLMRYKGAHTKESHVFKATMRFDFESFVSQFTSYLRDRILFAQEILGIDIVQERNEFFAFAKERIAKDKEAGEEPKKYSYLDFAKYKYPGLEWGEQDGSTHPLAVPTQPRMTAYLIAQAIHDLDESEHLASTVKKIAEAREKEKGKGIYLDRSGRPYSLDNPDLDKVIKADREARQQAEQNYGN